VFLSLTTLSAEIGNRGDEIMPSKVVFSERAYTAILAETNEKITTETGGVFLGVMSTDIWYVIETIDPGPNSIFKTAYFEYDRKYINHLANKINKLYADKLSVLGLWHRHPGSMDVFSDTDGGTNKQFAEGNGGTAISAIVNIDPKFRMTMYSVTCNPIRYTTIHYAVDDYEILRTNAKLTPSRNIEALINSYETQRQNDFRDMRIQTAPSQSRDSSFKILFSLALYIKKQPCSTDNWVGLKNTEQDFDEIVSQLYDAIEYCSKKGLSTTIEKGIGGAVNLIFGTNSYLKTLSFFYIDFSNNSFIVQNKGIRSLFSDSKKMKVSGKEICFLFEDRLYLYDDDMFKNALTTF